VVAYGQQETCSGILIGSGWAVSLDYVRRRTAQGKSKPEIMRCLKRSVVREIFGHRWRPPKPAPSDRNAD
jgi:hypothetical protein